MTDLAVFVQPSAPDERAVAPAELEVLRRNPPVIDGEVADPEAAVVPASPRGYPLWPLLIIAGVALAYLYVGLVIL